MPSARILIAEDDPRQARLLTLYLERDGFAVVVAPDGLTALEEFRRRQPDLLILDVMMPHLNGLDVCRAVRAESTVPILIVTARAEEEDLLAGLELGADDYVAKPYKPRELVARTRALLRRNRMIGAQDDTVTLGQISLDRTRRRVAVSGSEVELTAKEFDLLATLMAEPGRVFSRAKLLESAFGFDYRGLERTADAHIRTLRRKLGDDPTTPRFIETVYGVGYRMIDAP